MLNTNGFAKPEALRLTIPLRVYLLFVELS